MVTRLVAKEAGLLDHVGFALGAQAADEARDEGEEVRGVHVALLSKR